MNFYYDTELNDLPNSTKYLESPSNYKLKIFPLI